MQEEDGPFRTRVAHHHPSERDVLVDLEEADIGFLLLLGVILGISRRDIREHCNSCRGADKVSAMEIDLFRTGVHGQSPWFDAPQYLIRRRLALPLRLRCFDPPRQIVGKARECLFKRLAALADRLAFGR